MTIEKIPVKIVQTQDIHGNKKIGVMLDVAYYIDSIDNIDYQIQEFKQLYFKTLADAKKIIPKKRKRRKPSDIWELAKILANFNSKGSEFFITNYTTALQRDFGLTDSYVGEIFQFWKYFKKEEISDEIPFSNYMELTRKRQQLLHQKLWEKEKKRFLEHAKNGTYLNNKEYRKELKELLSRSKM